MSVTYQSFNGKYECQKCGSSETELTNVTSNRFGNTNPPIFNINHTFHCKKCGKYSFTREELFPKKDCLHDKTSLAIIILQQLPFSSYLEIYGSLCLDCFVMLFTCRNLKEKIDRIYPHFWNLIDKRYDLKIIYRNCDYCADKAPYNLKQETTHSFIRAIELVGEKDKNLYNFYFDIDNAGVNKVHNRIREIDEERNKIYWSDKLIKFLKQSYLKGIEAERKNCWRTISDYTKRFDVYGREARNELRRKYNLPCIGEGWISETRLYKLVQKVFPDETVLFHTRPRWLEGLEIDIYLPNRKIAIEYQGKQHYERVEHFGGENAYLVRQEHDRKKLALCGKNNVKLIYFDYRTEVNEDNLSKLL